MNNFVTFQRRGNRPGVIFCLGFSFFLLSCIIKCNCFYTRVWPAHQGIAFASERKRFPRMKKDRLFYSANLVGLTVLLYLTLSTLLRGALSLFLSVYQPGAELHNPVGMPELLIQLLNLVCSLVNLGVPLWMLCRTMRPLNVRLPLGRPPRRQLLAALPLFLLFTTVCTAGANGLRILLSKGGYQAPEAAQLPSGGVALFLCFLATCVLPAIGEELLFRGGIQQLLRPWGDWFAILVTSFFFSFLHHDLSQLPSIFAMSMFLGYIAVVTGSVRASIWLHFANNLSSFLLLWARQRLDATNLLGLTVLLFAIYISCGLFALLQLRRVGLLQKLSRCKVPKNQMARWERLLYAPLCSFTALLLVLTTVMEYFR